MSYRHTSYCRLKPKKKPVRSCRCRYMGGGEVVVWDVLLLILDVKKASFFKHIIASQTSFFVTGLKDPLHSKFLDLIISMASGGFLWMNQGETKEFKLKHYHSLWMAVPSCALNKPFLITLSWPFMHCHNVTFQKYRIYFPIHPFVNSLIC